MDGEHGEDMVHVLLHVDEERRQGIEPVMLYDTVQMILMEQQVVRHVI